MGQSAEQLRREIEDTRGDLGYTLDAIGDRLSPGRMIERARTASWAACASVRERVDGNCRRGEFGGGTSRSHGGRCGRRGRRHRANRAECSPSAGPGQPSGRRAVSFGVGILLASVFPATASEQQAADRLVDKAQPLKDELIDTGKDMADHLKEPARQAFDQVKDVATEGTESVADAAKSAADATSQTAAWCRPSDPLRHDWLVTPGRSACLCAAQGRSRLARRHLGRRDLSQRALSALHAFGRVRLRWPPEHRRTPRTRDPTAACR